MKPKAFRIPFKARVDPDKSSDGESRGYSDVDSEEEIIGKEMLSDTANRRDSNGVSLNSDDQHTFTITPRQGFGKDFNDDLITILARSNLDFSGRYCHLKYEESAPNPHISIKGFGTISIPFSSRDAKSLVEYILPTAPSGRESPNTKLYELESSQISFQNPVKGVWNTFVQETIADTVWGDLGVPLYYQLMVCKLTKLVISEPGSPALFQNSGDKSERTFARIVIQLPSTFSGGECRYTQGANVQVVDVAERSQVTSVLGFYLDSQTHFAPITSGYRLALCYDVFCPPSYSQPALPKENLTLLSLRHILQLRRENPQYHLGSKHLDGFVYLFQTAASKAKPGENSPSQAQEIRSYLRKAVAATGYLVFEGTLERHEGGESDTGPNPFNRDDDGHDLNVEDMDMKELQSAATILENIRNLDGEEIAGATVRLSKSVLIPRRPFTGVKPDKKSFEEYSLDWYWRRTALLIVTKDQESMVLGKAEASYWLNKLKGFSPDIPIERDRELAMMVPKRLIRKDEQIRELLLQFAFSWKDLALWSKAVHKLGRTFSISHPELLIDGWKTFSFTELQPIFDQVVQKIPMIEGYEGRLGFIQSLSKGTQVSTADAQAYAKWCSLQGNAILDDMDLSDENYVEPTIAVAKVFGTCFLVDRLLPRLREESTSFGFICSFICELKQESKGIPVHTMGCTCVTVDDIAIRSLRAVLQRPKTEMYQLDKASPLGVYYDATTERLKMVLKLCILTGQLDECMLPLQLLLHLNNDSASDYQWVRQDLLPVLIQWLRDAKYTVLTPPFTHFFAAVIESHLSHLLDRPAPTEMIDIPKFGCGNLKCRICEQVDTFIHDANKALYDEKANYEEVDHLNKYYYTRIKGLRWDVCRREDDVYYYEYCLSIQKDSQFQEFQRWSNRVRLARDLLAQIGTDEDIAELMGEVYEDIKKALEGKTPFVSSGMYLEAFGSITEETLGIRSSPDLVVESRSGLMDITDHTFGSSKRKFELQNSTFDPPTKRSKPHASEA